jgi:hypothetical protein
VAPRGWWIVATTLAVFAIVAGTFAVRNIRDRDVRLRDATAAYKNADQFRSKSNALLYTINHSSHAFDSAYRLATLAGDKRHEIHDKPKLMLVQAKIEQHAVENMGTQDQAESDAALDLIALSETRFHYSATEPRAALRKLRLDRSDGIRAWSEAIGDIVDLLQADTRGEYRTPSHNLTEKYDASTHDLDRAVVDVSDFNAQLQRIINKNDADYEAALKTYIDAGGKP